MLGNIGLRSSLIVGVTVTLLILTIFRGRFGNHRTDQILLPQHTSDLTTHFPPADAAGRISYSKAVQKRKNVEKEPPIGADSYSTAIASAEMQYKNKHYKEAFEQFSQLAQEGSPVAMRRLGNLYHFGEGIPQDFAQAFDWYERAFIAGDDASPHHIGRFYFNGEGTERDEEEAYYWYRHSALRGHVAGMSWMGYFYAHGTGGVKQDRLTAIAWYMLIKNRDRDGSLRTLYRDMPIFSSSEIDQIQRINLQLEEELKRYRR